MGVRCISMCVCLRIGEGRGGHLACDNNPGKTPIPSEEEGAEGGGCVREKDRMRCRHENRHVCVCVCVFLD